MAMIFVWTFCYKMMTSDDLCFLCFYSRKKKKRKQRSLHCSRDLLDLSFFQHVKVAPVTIFFMQPNWKHIKKFLHYYLMCFMFSVTDGIWNLQGLMLIASSPHWTSSRSATTKTNKLVIMDLDLLPNFNVAAWVLPHSSSLSLLLLLVSVPLPWNNYTAKGSNLLQCEWNFGLGIDSLLMFLPSSLSFLFTWFAFGFGFFACCSCAVEDSVVSACRDETRFGFFVGHELWMQCASRSSWWWRWWLQ